MPSWLPVERCPVMVRQWVWCNESFCVVFEDKKLKTPTQFVFKTSVHGVRRHSTVDNLEERIFGARLALNDHKRCTLKEQKFLKSTAIWNEHGKLSFCVWNFEWLCQVFSIVGMKILMISNWENHSSEKFQFDNGSWMLFAMMSEPLCRKNLILHWELNAGCCECMAQNTLNECTAAITSAMQGNSLFY